jgi:hypothetical protein
MSLDESTKIQIGFYIKKIQRSTPSTFFYHTANCLIYLQRKNRKFHGYCRGAANHSRVAEGTRPNPEGVYSGVAGLRSISLKNTMNTAGFRVVRAAGA